MKRAARRMALTAAVLVFVAQVYGAEPKKSSRLSGFIEKALKSGEATYFQAPMAKLFALPEMPCQHFEVPRSSTTDGFDHKFHLLVEESDGSDIPRHVIFERVAIEGSALTCYLFKTDLSGNLVSVARVDGRIISETEGQRGSGVVTHPAADAPDVRERFQHELDFWLKNAYRKPKPKKKP